MKIKPRIKYSLQFFTFLFIVSLPLKTSGYGQIIGELPEDERAALIELDEGFLDSSQWELLKPFYNQPLSVPLGELRYLRDILPDLPEDLPTRPEILSYYEPWTDESICAFFRDYPYLVQFRPVLSFDIERMPSFAHISFFSHLLGISKQFRQSVRFNVYPLKNVQADGTVYFQDEFARWQRRRILLKIPSLGQIQVGNFSFTMNNGIFYGYFPSTVASHDTLKYNWLYGESRTWNGLLTETPIGGKSMVRTLFHIRNTESIAGLKAEYNPISFLSFYGAFSGAFSQIDSVKYDTSVALHGGIGASVGLIDINVESGVDLFNAGCIPVYITLSNNIKKQKHSLSFVRIPSGFSAPRSSILHAINSRLGSDEQSGDIIGIDFSYAGSFSKYFKQNFSTSYIAVNNNANLKTSLKLSGSLPFQYACYYWLDVYNLSYNFKHQFKLSSTHDIGKKFSVSPSVSYYIKSDNYWRIMADIKTGFNLFSILDFSPFIDFITTSEKAHDLAVGVIQRTTFFKKTFIEAKLIIPIISKYNEKYSFYANAHFLF